MNASVPTGAKARKGGVAKHVPERTCVACRTSRPKRHLVKLMRTPEGPVEVDKTGRRSGGRGAYLCPAQECWRLAKARKSLEQALEIQIAPDNWEQLEAYSQGLPEARL